MPLRKVPVVWQTGPGGTGVNNFYTLDTVDATVEILAFFSAIKAQFSDSISWTVPNAGDTIDQNSGKIIGAWTGGTAGTWAGTAHSPYAAGTGAFIRWQTGGIRDGRRVRGRTFLCPILAGGFQDDGTLLGTYVTSFQGAATTLAATGKLQIYCRPTAKGLLDGTNFAVLAGTVPDKVTSLKSRRH